MEQLIGAERNEDLGFYDIADANSTENTAATSTWLPRGALPRRPLIVEDVIQPHYDRYALQAWLRSRDPENALIASIHEAQVRFMRAWERHILKEGIT